VTRGARIEGGLIGLLVGDALGVPYEFHRPETLPALQAIEMTPPPGFRRAHAGIAPGTWSDDGAQALCLLASLLDRGGLDLDDFAQRLLRWYEEGYLAVDGQVFDVGIQTSAALQALRRGTPPDQAGPSDERANGNGSLMRVLPLALWHGGDDGTLVRDAHRSSLPTHGHARSQMSCALYCLWARGELAGEADPWASAVAKLRTIYAQDGHDEALRDELATFAQDADARVAGGSGYVLDSLASARHACREASFEAILKSAIALGHDTDTTACIAGGIAGIRHGVAAIPTRWRQALRGRELLEPLRDRLLGRHGIRHP
jgi:ADP-ribosyl-[dinitrogen reductase] hydrolase